MLLPFYLHALMLILASMIKVHIMFVASIALSIKYRGSVDPMCVCFAFQKHIQIVHTSRGSPSIFCRVLVCIVLFNIPYANRVLSSIHQKGGDC